MGWLKAIQGFFGAINGFFRMQERNEDQKAGANKVKVAQYEKADEVRKDANRTWDKPKRKRLKRKS